MPLPQPALPGHRNRDGRKAMNTQQACALILDVLAELVMALRDNDRLCLVHEEEQSDEPQIICSLGLAKENV